MSSIISDELYLRCNTENQFNGTISDFLQDLYVSLSTKPLPIKVTLPDHGWDKFISIIYKAALQEPPEILYDDLIINKDLFGKLSGCIDNRVILGFSGGKDSTAVAHYLVAHGYDVVLYNAKGLNKQYPDEYGSAKSIAEYLGLEMITDNVRVGGHCDYPDNPVKNQLIMARMISWCIENSCYNVAMGMQLFAHDGVSNINYNMSDDCDLNRAFVGAIRQYIPKFDLFVFLRDPIHSIIYLLQQDKSLLDMCNQCVTPYRFRDMRKKYVENKYGVCLPSKRCGYCWKCNIEYLTRAYYGDIEKNDEYIRLHVIPCIRKKIQEFDNTISKTEAASMTDEEIINACIDIDAIVKYIKDESILADIGEISLQKNKNYARREYR